MKKIFLSTLVALLFIPAVTYASWWNPLTWFKPIKIKQTVETVAPRTTDLSSSNSGTQTINSSLEDENQKLKKELTDLKRKNTSATTTVKATSVSNLVKKSETIVSTPTTKTCLSGNVIPISELCTKSCPDGEVVAETVTCRNGMNNLYNTLQQIVTKNSDCTEFNKRKQTATEEASRTYELLLKNYNDQRNVISSKWENMKLDVRRQYETILTGQSSTDVSYRATASERDKKINDLEDSKQGELAVAASSFNLEVQTINARKQVGTTDFSGWCN